MGENTLAEADAHGGNVASKQKARLSICPESGSATFFFDFCDGVVRSAQLDREAALNLAATLQDALATPTESHTKLAAIERRLEMMEHSQAALAGKIFDLDTNLSVAVSQFSVWKNKIEQVRQLLMAISLRTRKFP